MATLVGDKKDLLEGFDIVCNAVKRTLGAEGKLAVLENTQMGVPKVTKDGVSVARHIVENDPVKYQGVLLAKQAAIKTLVEIGDNTTTTLVLAQSLIKEIGDNFNKKMEFGIEEAHKDAQRYLNKFAKKTNKKTVRDIATVSANNDKNIGEIIARAYEESNNGEGIIDSVQSIKEKSVSLKVSTGMKLDRGWFTPSLINNEPKGIFEAENCNVLVFEGYEIHDSEEVKSFINSKKNKGEAVLLVVERLGDPTFATEKLAKVVMSGASVMLIEAPMYRDDDSRIQTMRDIALYTGGKVYRQGQQEPLEAGLAEKVTVNLNSTNISNARNQEVEEKLKELKNLQGQDAEIDTDFLNHRIKTLEGKSVTVVVGGDIEVGASEVFDRVDDAIKAVKSVLLEGSLAGGGSALAYISNLMNRSFENKDMQYGYDAFKRALLSPLKQICENARREPDEHLKKAFEIYGWGYNGTTDETSNLLKDSIIDSKKGISVALKNAKATAILILNIDVISTISHII